MTNKTVLIVEDSEYLAESLADMLNLRGHTALIARNGLDGISQAFQEHPDLILLDIRLPDIDGYEVYQRIKSDSWGKDANIVILTASESTENISKNIDLPADHVLFKPDWSLPNLMEKIDSFLEVS